MTDPATLLALADRCEQAAGPDRVLDSDIAYALGWTFKKRGNEKRAWWRDRNGEKNVPPPFGAVYKETAAALRARAVAHD
jgi:hypothetical protein